MPLLSPVFDSPLLSYTPLGPTKRWHRQWLPWLLIIGVVASSSLLYLDASLRATRNIRSTLSDIVLGSLSPVVTCPSPHDVGARTLDHHTQTCFYVPSTHPEFSLQICHDSSLCNAFTVRIERTDPEACQQAESLPDPSDDLQLAHWIRTNRGPEAFLIKTDGAQRYAATWSDYHGNCSYSFDVRLKNAGPVYLQVWQTYEHYEAFSETNTSWPEQLWSPLTTNPIQMDICPATCAPLTSDLMVPERGLYFYPPDSHEFVRQDFTDCTGPEPVLGSYMPLNPLDVLYPPYPAPVGRNLTPVANRYHFVPESCNFRHTGLRFGDPTPCTERKTKVVMWGDSHGRIVHDAFVWRMQGNKGILTSSEKSGNKSATVGNMETNFQWDPLARSWLEEDKYNDSCNRIAGADAFGLSIGSHLAGGSTTERFTSELIAVLKLISECPSLPKRLVYFTPPAQPPRRDNFIRKYRDHRTNVRLHHWSDRGAEIALAQGWAVINQYAYTIHHHEEIMAIDMAHYLMSDAIDPIVDETVEKFGACPRLTEVLNV